MLKYSTNLTERTVLISNTCLKLMVIFVRIKIVIIFSVRYIPNNKFLNVTSKQTNKIMWLPC